MFDYDATGVQPSSQGQGKILPKAWFNFEIISYTTNDGSKTYPMEGYTKENHYPKVDLLLQVIDNPEYEDCRVFHTVTFMPKDKDGAGMAIHFLKCINQPFEGKIKPNSEDWVGEKLQGYAITDEYKGKTKNKLGEIRPYATPTHPEIAKAAKNDDVPF